MRPIVPMLSLAVLCCLDARAQFRIPNGEGFFLNEAPDARSGGMGQAGVATEADANALHWNPAKLTQAEHKAGVTASYGSYLRNLVDDMWIGYAAAYARLGEKNAVGLSYKNFNYDWMDVSLVSTKSIDYAVGASYARQLGNHFSMGVTLKYFHSDRGFFVVNGASIKPANLPAADISAFYTRKNRNEETGEDLTWSLGAVIANIGGNVDYGIPAARNPLATMAKLGGALSYTATGKHRLSVAADLNKLLVPTPASQGTGVGNNKPLVNRMLSSFSDAPGGFREEMQEIVVAMGVEYYYNDMIAVRGGYHGEHKEKGGRKIFTAGLGAKILNNYTADFSYNFPATKDNPFGENFRISVGAYFGGKRG